MKKREGGEKKKEETKNQSDNQKALQNASQDQPRLEAVSSLVIPAQNQFLSNQESSSVRKDNRGDRIRTCDVLVPNQVL